MSPVFTFGRFFFVAPSNARYEREAGSLVPMSTLKYFISKIIFIASNKRQLDPNFVWDYTINMTTKKVYGCLQLQKVVSGNLKFS